MRRSQGFSLTRRPIRSRSYWPGAEALGQNEAAKGLRAPPSCRMSVPRGGQGFGVGGSASAVRFRTHRQERIRKEWKPHLYLSSRAELSATLLARSPAG